MLIASDCSLFQRPETYGKMKGLILKSQLLVLLKYRVSNNCYHCEIDSFQNDVLLDID